MGESFLERVARKRRELEEAKVNEQISEVLWRAQMGEDYPRIIRLDRVNLNDAYELAGTMWPDGRTRIVAHPRTVINEAATIALMDRKDAARG